MFGVIPVFTKGGCLHCGNPKIDVPESYQEDTIILCRECGYFAACEEFFGRRETDAAEPRASGFNAADLNELVRRSAPRHWRSFNPY